MCTAPSPCPQLSQPVNYGIYIFVMIANQYVNLYVDARYGVVRSRWFSLLFFSSSWLFFFFFL